MLQWGKAGPSAAAPAQMAIPQMAVHERDAAIFTADFIQLGP
jgi:hypothetical protein